MAKEATTFRISSQLMPVLRKLAKAEGRTASSLIRDAVEEFLKRNHEATDKNMPKCEDFIVAAIRKLRTRPTHMKEGVCAGANLSKIYVVAREIYADEEFRSALNSLLKCEKVIAVVTGWAEDPRGPRSKYGPSGDRRMFSIPTNAPIERAKFCVDLQWNLVDDETAKKVIHQDIQSIILYLKADGLPDKVIRILEGRGGFTTAQEIINSMQE